MSKVFTGLEHFWAWFTGKLIPKAETIAADVEGVLGTEAATALLTLAGKQDWAPKMQSVVGSIVSALAMTAQDGVDFAAAVKSLGLNPLLDQKAFTDLEDIFKAVKQVVGGKTLTITTAQTVPVPSK